MASNKTVEHTGIVQEINNELIRVNIVSQSACAACHAKGACSSADVQDKVIEIKNWKEKFEIGERVNVVLQKSLGPKAILWGYFFPFLVLIISLIIASNYTKSEAMVGLISIFSLVPYYFTLYLFKNSFSKTFSFAIKKI